MTTSVVIPAYNGRQYLQQNLPAVMALGADEVVVVDDASTDDSAKFITDNFPKTKLIRHLINKRFPISVNDGFTATNVDVVFLLNQDVLPDRDLIKNTLSHFKDPSVFAVTFNEKDRSWADGKWVNGMLEFKNGKLDNHTHQSLWASGGSAAFRKSTWDKLGGFDPIFTPGYFEDLDLGLRASHAGYKIIWDPKCRVTHTSETSISKVFPPKKLRRIKDRNYLLAIWKNMPKSFWPAHFITLFKRIARHPGYIIPVKQAIWKKLVS